MTSKQADGITNCSDSKDDKKETKRNTLLPFCERIHSWRWVTVLVVWLGFINVTLMGNSFNMALVCMTGSEPPPRGNISMTANSAEDFSSNSTTASNQSFHDGEFNWSQESQGILLSASMYVSFITPAISGFLARRYGPRKVVGFSITGRAVLHLLTPLFARTHLYVLIAARVIQGGITNTLIPSTQGLWAQWAPDQEKVQITAWTQSGVNIGTLLASLVSGFLCLIPIDNGWPFVFYVFGSISALWCILWWILVYDAPENHKWIKESEVTYIKDNMKTKPDKNQDIPYKAFLTSKPLFAYFVIGTVHKWCATIYFAYLPKYMRDVLLFPIEQNAIVSSVPFASRFIGVIFWGMLSDQMARKKISTTANRKIIQSTGFLICAALTTSLGFISEENKFIAVGVFVVTMFFQSCTFASSAVIPLDLAPKLSGIIAGVYQSAGNVLAMFAPMLVAYMTPDNTLEQWRSVFYMITATYIFGVSVFVLTGSAELQPWGGAPDESTIDSPTETQDPKGANGVATVVGGVTKDHFTNGVTKNTCVNLSTANENAITKDLFSNEVTKKPCVNGAATNVDGVTKNPFTDGVMTGPGVNGAATYANGVTKNQFTDRVTSVSKGAGINTFTNNENGDILSVDPRVIIEHETLQYEGEKTASTTIPDIKVTSVHFLGEESNGGIVNQSFINDDVISPFERQERVFSCFDEVNERAFVGQTNPDCTGSDDVVNKNETQLTRL